MSTSCRLDTVTLLTVLTLALPGSDAALAEPPSADRLDELTLRYADEESFRELREFLRIPNDAHRAGEVEANRVWVEAAFERRGFSTRVLPTGGPPLLLAERPASGAGHTVLVYLQIDGQPVDPAAWDQDPFTPTLKAREGDGWRVIEWERLTSPGRDPDWRLFARSASDAKGPVAMFLTAVRALDAEGLAPPFDLKVIMDFEEELGSPHLPEAVEAHREALAADMLIILDGPRHLSNRPTLSFGARGIAEITLTVFGPRAPVHSGHYGNYVPNPAVRLAQLIASMKDRSGRVVIPGFYDGVSLDDATRELLARVPDDEAEMRTKLGFAEPDGVAPTLQEAIQFPSLNVRGLASAWIGEGVRTIIPSTATAEIDVRLVKESDPERLIRLIRSHVEGQGYHLVEGEPTEEERRRHPRIASFRSSISYTAFRTPLQSEVGEWLRRAIVRAFGEEPIRKRTSGGSIPISPFVRSLGIPAVTVPTVNADNNQHSPNENLRVGNYIDGVKTFLAILTEPIDSP
jgi:acetylornithine deacetylase/succinyl-diaminopimelate desuccinylase-like protein